MTFKKAHLVMLWTQDPWTNTVVQDSVTFYVHTQKHSHNSNSFKCLFGSSNNATR